jgi:hypothetical protein
MSIVRGLDQNHDWLFGIGKNAYLSQTQAIAQQIRSRLLEFKRDCFWNVQAGVDWFKYLGGKDQLGLDLAVRTVILNTPQVTGLKSLVLNLNHKTRELKLQYEAVTVFSPVSDQLTVSLPV